MTQVASRQHESRQNSHGNSFRCSGGAWQGLRKKYVGLKPQRTFRMYVLLFDRMHAVPKRQRSRNDQSNHNADQKEPAISRQRDQENRHHCDRHNQPPRPLQPESRAAAGFRLHEFILALLSKDDSPSVLLRPVGLSSPPAGNFRPNSLQSRIRYCAIQCPSRRLAIAIMEVGRKRVRNHFHALSSFVPEILVCEAIGF